MSKTLKKSLYLGFAVLSVSGLAGLATNNSASAKSHHVRYARKGKMTHRSNRKNNVHKKASSSLTKSEYALANKKFSYVSKIGKKSSMGRETMKNDKYINKKKPFNKKNYVSEYVYALNHPALINGAQDLMGGQLTGTKDGLSDYGQFAAVKATKRYAKKHHMSKAWVQHNTNMNNKHGFYYWYFTGFNDNNGGDDSNGAKRLGHKTGLYAYKAGVNDSKYIKNHKASRGLIHYTMHHLSNTILSDKYNQLF